MLKNTGGTAITLTERVNYFNNDRVSSATSNITIQPGATHTQTTRWCSSVDAEHTFRTDWSGSVAGGAKITATGPTVRLLKK